MTPPYTNLYDRTTNNYYLDPRIFNQSELINDKLHSVYTK